MFTLKIFFWYISVNIIQTKFYEHIRRVPAFFYHLKPGKQTVRKVPFACKHKHTDGKLNFLLQEFMLTIHYEVEAAIAQSV
jgi:hypothetical protein